MIGKWMIHQVFHCLWVDKGFTATEVQLFCILPKTEEMFWWKSKDEYWILGLGDHMNRLQAGLKFGLSIRKVLPNGISFFTPSLADRANHQWWLALLDTSAQSLGLLKKILKKNKNPPENDQWTSVRTCVTLSTLHPLSNPLSKCLRQLPPPRVCGGYENSL